MDKNQIIGVSLLVVIVIVFSIINRPSPEQLAKEQRMRDSLAAVEQAQGLANAHEEQATLVPGDAEAIGEGNDSIQAPEETFFTLSNDNLEVKVSNLGGGIAYLRLKNYQRPDTTQLILTDVGRNQFGFTTNAGNPSTSQWWFQVAENSGNRLVLESKQGDGSARYIYELPQEGYSLNFNTEWQGIVAQQLVWTQELMLQEHKAENERMKTTVYYKEQGSEPDFVSERKDEDEAEVGLDAPVEWISFKQHFFNQTIVAKQPMGATVLQQDYAEGDDYLRKLHASATLPAAARLEFNLIAAPNHFNTLKKFDIQLERVVNLGWGIFGWVNRFLVIPVFNLLNGITHNYGLIILILTLVFKALLFFFTYKSFLSGAKMRVLKPELDSIKKKHEGDMQAQQAEQMKLYQLTGVSPFGGCLPMLVQMPILLALFNFFPNSFELRQKSFLWATDLSSYDSIYNFGFYIPAYGDHVSLFALLMTISTFLYTLINQSYQPPQQKELKYLPYIMPIMFLAFLNNYSAALSYYYFLANAISIGQTYLFKYFVDEDKLKAQIEDNKRKKALAPGGAAPAGMQGRMQGWLEKQQRKQQAVQQQRNQKKKK